MQNSTRNTPGPVLALTFLVAACAGGTELPPDNLKVDDIPRPSRQIDGASGLPENPNPDSMEPGEGPTPNDVGDAEDTPLNPTGGQVDSGEPQNRPTGDAGDDDTDTTPADPPGLPNDDTDGGQDEESDEPQEEPDQGDGPADDAPEPAAQDDAPEEAPEPPAAEPEPAAAPVIYSFSDAESLLYVQVFKDRNALASGFAHDHVMRATAWDGTLTYHPDDPSDCAIDISLPVSELRVDEAAMRELVLEEGPLSDGDRQEIREHMLAANQLNGDAHPTIEFHSSDCSQMRGASGEANVVGPMTIAGSTAEIPTPLNYQLVDGQMFASGVIDTNHGTFGLSPYEAFFGAVRNAEQLRIVFDLVGTPIP